MSKAILRSEVQSPLINVCDDDLLRALDLCDSRTQQAHSTSAKHYNARIFRHQATSESVQSDTKRLQQRTNIQSHILRQLVTPLRGVVDLLLQRALEVWETLATAPEPELFADVVTTFRAACTAAAGQADFESDSVACFEVCDGRADGRDDASGFVTEGEGFADEDIAVAVVGVVVQVAATEAGGGYPDLELV